MERTTTDWRQVGLLFAAGLLAAAQFGKISLSLGPLAALYLGHAAVPFLVSMVAVTGILLGPVVGGIVTRIGIRRSVLGALVLGAAISGFQAMLPPLPLLVVSRLVEGASHLALVVALPTLMAEAATPRDRPVAMGLWGTYFGLTFAALALLLPWLVALGGMSAVFAGHGLAMAAMALVLAPILPRGAGQRTSFRLGAELRAIYTTPRLIGAAGMFLWHALAFIAMLAYLPAALGAPWIAAVLPLISLVGTFGAGFAARSIAPPRLAAGAFALNLVLALAVLAFPLAAVPLTCAMFLCMGVVPGAAFAAVPWLNPDLGQRARANGALAQLGNVGTFSGTPLLAFTGTALTPLMLAMLAIAACGLAVSLLIAWAFRRQPAT